MAHPSVVSFFQTSELGDMEDSEEETAWADDLNDVDTMLMEEKKKVKKTQREERRKQQEAEKQAKQKPQLAVKKIGIKAN